MQTLKYIVLRNTNLQVCCNHFKGWLVYILNILVDAEMIAKVVFNTLHTG